MEEKEEEDEEKEDEEEDPKEPKPDPKPDPDADPKLPNDEPEPNEPNPELDPNAPNDVLGFSEEEEDEEDTKAPAKTLDVAFGSLISFFHPKEMGVVFAGELVLSSFPSDEDEEAVVVVEDSV